jgi:hypothetical protein
VNANIGQIRAVHVQCEIIIWIRILIINGFVGFQLKRELSTASYDIKEALQNLIL